MPSSSDALIAGRYRLGDKIADGGMSSVWEAWDERLHRRVAVKQLRLQAGLNEEDARLAAERAMREARITARLHHPNAVPVYDVVDDDGAPCLVMQYLPSRTLQAVLAERTTLDAATVARIGGEVASALAAAHEAGIVHRDVKPGNVLIDTDGAAKLTDFGISHALGDVTLTSTGMVTGTPAYLAPEAARGEPAGFPADVFALGATLCTALEGTPPVGNSDNPIAVLHRVASGQINRPEQTSPLTALLNRMLALDPSARPAMPDVAAELDHIARLEGASAGTTEQIAAVPGAGANGAAPPSTTVILPPARDDAARAAAPAGAAAAPPVDRPPARPASTPRRRRRGPLAALAVVAALLVLGFVLLGVYLTRGNSGTPTAVGSTTPVSSAPARHSSSPHTSASSKRTSSTSSAPSTSRASTSSSSTNSATSSGAAVSAIENYYALLPNGTNQAWQRLTAKYQHSHAGGRGAYEKFWHQYRSVQTSNVHSIGHSRVEADLTYTKTGGSVIHEVDDYTLIQQGGMLKIDQSDLAG